jgi:hypothetical protein
VLLQFYETAARRDTRCQLLSRPLGLLQLEPDDALAQQSFGQISRLAHVFVVASDDENQQDIFVRDTAYEKLQA